VSDELNTLARGLVLLLLLLLLAVAAIADDAWKGAMYAASFFDL
jgi:hypothetical protein